VVQRAAGITAMPVLVPAGELGVMEAAADADLLVVGLSDRWRTEGLGAARLDLARSARPPVLLVRRGVRPSVLAPAEELSRYTWSIADVRTDTSS
jgi:hypothetical protein